jgi:hypothetical protein
MVSTLNEKKLDLIRIRSHEPTRTNSLYYRVVNAQCVVILLIWVTYGRHKDVYMSDMVHIFLISVLRIQN